MREPTSVSASHDPASGKITFTQHGGAPAEPRAAEDCAALAQFMGWQNIPRIGTRAWLTGERINDIRWIPDDWNPFVSADADVQVLERVREVWGYSANWTRFVLAFSRPLLADVKSHDFAPHVAFSIVLGEFRVGSFARAALTVLRDMVEG